MRGAVEVYDRCSTVTTFEGLATLGQLLLRGPEHTTDEQSEHQQDHDGPGYPAPQGIRDHFAAQTKSRRHKTNPAMPRTMMEYSTP